MKKIRKNMLIIITIILISVWNNYVIANNDFTAVSAIGFKVRFSGEPKVSNKDKVKAFITNDLNATINVNGLTIKENVETVTYEIQNVSTDLSATLNVETKNSNQEFFEIETDIERNILSKGDTTKLIIKIKLLKEPNNDLEEATIGIVLKANPIQPEDNQNYGETSSSSKESNGTSQYGYYEKDETPKTGDLRITEIIWR